MPWRVSTTLVEQLKKVLTEMRERESINDLKKRLQEMIDRLEKLNERRSCGSLKS